MKHSFFRVSAFLTTLLLAGLTGKDAVAQIALQNATTEEGTFSRIFEQIGQSFGGAPGLIAMAAYAMGVVLAVGGILKIKEYVENPQQVSLREPFARFVIGGALFALPYVMKIATQTIGPQTGKAPSIADGTLADGLVDTTCFSDTVTDIFDALGGGTIGSMICQAVGSFEAAPALLTVGLYIAGVFLVMWSLLLLKDYIIQPDRAPLSASVKRMIVAGIFFAFPYFLEVVTNTFQGGDRMIAADPFAISLLSSLFSGSGACVGSPAGDILNAVTGSSSGGLDCMMIRLVSNIWGPLQMAVSFFAYVAGLIIIALAVRRLMDGMDKGARGPVGVGTLGMLFVGGALLSFDTIISTISVSLFPDMMSMVGAPNLKLNPMLSYDPGLSDSATASVIGVITAVVAFSFLVGIISIVRGLFILKEVSNGGNASLMAGFTHLLGGGMAVNLGPVIMAVQNTLGVSDIGLCFGDDAACVISSFL